MPNRPAAFLLSAILALGAAPALAQSNLAGLSGEWTGSGTARNPPTSSAGKAFCRVNVNEKAGNGGWAISGRCSDGQGTSSVSIDVTRQGGNAVSGVVRSGASGESLRYIGNIDGDRIRLQSSAPITISGNNYDSVLTIGRQSGGLALANDLTDLRSGQNIRATAILFQRD